MVEVLDAMLTPMGLGILFTVFFLGCAFGSAMTDNERP